MLNVIHQQREMFQQDNTRSHTARVTIEFLTHNINVLAWPSTDLNLLKHRSDEFDRRVRQQQTPPQSLVQFIQGYIMNGKGYRRS